MTQRVLITAGAAGIGLAIAEAFVAAGARVHIADVNAEAVDEVTKHNSASVEPWATSVSLPRSTACSTR